MRIAILGANGQVGAEVTLLLRNHPGVEVVPICRNPAGSAFLRWSGVPVRHGLVEDPAQARSLLAGCDVVLNFALAGGDPRAMREAERRIIGNAVSCSGPGARHVYFSSVVVTREPLDAPRSSYARLKLESERAFLRAASGAGKPGAVLRLGHVCGDLQDITALIRRRILSGPVVFPAQDGPSNTVATATVVEAALWFAGGKLVPGTWDLVSRPEWTWPEVYRFEAERIGATLTEGRIPPVDRETRIPGGLFGAAMRWATARVRRSRAARPLFMKIASLCSPSFNARAAASWRALQARSEIDRLRSVELTDEAMAWGPLARRVPHGLTVTRTLLADPLFRLAAPDSAKAWPPELPPA